MLTEAFAAALRRAAFAVLVALVACTGASAGQDMQLATDVADVAPTWMNPETGIVHALPVSELDSRDEVLGSSVARYPELRPSLQQASTLRSIGPVVRLGSGATPARFADLEAWRQWLWSKPSHEISATGRNSPYWTLLRLGGYEVPGWTEQCYSPSPTGGAAGLILLDVLRGQSCGSAKQLAWRSVGTVGGHSSDYAADWRTVYPGSVPTVGQWLAVLANHTCAWGSTGSLVWCGDSGLRARAARERCDDWQAGTPWAPSPWTERWTETQWLIYLRGPCGDNADATTGEVRCHFHPASPECGGDPAPPHVPPPPPTPAPPTPPPDSTDHRGRYLWVPAWIEQAVRALLGGCDGDPRCFTPGLPSTGKLSVELVQGEEP